MVYITSAYFFGLSSTYLQELYDKLNEEDSRTCLLRRALALSDILRKDLIPLLINSSTKRVNHLLLNNKVGGFPLNESRMSLVFKHLQTQRICLVRLLDLLTVPIECLVYEETSNDQTHTLQLVHELTHFLYNAKEAFLDSNVTRAILNHLRYLFKKQTLTNEDIESVNHSLLVFRNMLSAPERPSQMSRTESPSILGRTTESVYFNLHNHNPTDECYSQQNRLLWNLLNQGLDSLIINMLNCSHKDKWVVTIVQLVILLFKDHPVEKLKTGLSNMLAKRRNPSESWEDDESNTSHHSVGLYTQSSRELPNFSSDGKLKSLDSEGKASTFDEFSYSLTRVEISVAADLEEKKRGCNLDERDITSEKDIGQNADANSTTSKLFYLGGHRSISSGFQSGDSSACKKFNQVYVKRRKKFSKRRQIRNGVESKQIMESVNKTRNFEKVRKSYTFQQNARQQDSCLSSSDEIIPPRINQIKANTKHLHLPTEESISHLLEKFAIEFLCKGYSILVRELHQQLLHQNTVPLDKSHFFWLITYFLRFVTQLKLDILEQFEDVFNIDIVCYLTWEAVRETEEFEISCLQPSVDLKPNLRRLHLGVMAIREHLQAIETYLSLVASSDESSRNTQLEKIRKLCGYLPAVKDLRQLFLLRLRQFNPAIQSSHYLNDVIATNHVLLLTLERVSQQSNYGASFELEKHLHQFCSKTILSRYGMALENFKTNGSFVNDCIMTMFHHVGVELGRADLLCETTILLPFVRIWEEEFQMCDDWNDLIQYVVHKSLKRFQTNGFDKVRWLHGDSRNSIDQEELLNTSRFRQHFDVNEGHGTVLRDPLVTVPSDIESLKSHLIDAGLQEQLDWIQSALLTACSIRKGKYDGEEFRQPIACQSFKMNIACPIVPWTEAEARGLRCDLFLIFLHSMGLLSSDSQVILYPRIPREWSVEMLYSIACFIGPIDPQKLDFDLNRIRKVELPFSIKPETV